jgi:hypothetical protein
MSGDLPLLLLPPTEQLETTSGLLLAGEFWPLTPAFRNFPRCKALLLTVAVRSASDALETGFEEPLSPETDVFVDKLGGVGVRCKDDFPGWKEDACVDDEVLEAFVVTDEEFLFLGTFGDMAGEGEPADTLVTLFLFGTAGIAF